jgi:tetratricopeptide (TPR) repeat protein
VFRQPRRTGLLTVKLPHPIAALTIFALVLLIYVAAVIAYNPVLNSIHADHLWRIGASRVGLAAAVVAAVWLVFLWRRYIRALTASRPGGVDITVIPALANREASANQIAAELRNALTDVYLSGPSVVPGASAPQDFLTEVRGVAKQAPTSWGVVVGAMSLVSLRNVYRVSCTEQASNSGAGRGLTVEISGLPRQEASVTTVWGDTWALVARQAACHIAAYVLPRAKLSLRPPWIPWHGIKIPGELFYSFDEARRLARAGRLEESLHHFDDAIRRDPLNPYIRVERAAVYDQLGLWIDALASYVDAVTIESWFDRRSWKRYGRIIRDERRGGPSWFTRSPNGTAALLVARYRTVCSLAAAHRLARQWAENTSQQTVQSKQPKRRAETDLVIDRLRPLVVSYAELMMDAHGVGDKMRGAVKRSIARNDPRTLRRVFQFAALEEAAAIRDDYLRRVHRRHSLKPLAITKEALRGVPLWAALQYHYVELVQALTGPVTNFDSRLGPWTTRSSERPHSDRRHNIRWLEKIDAKVGLQAEAACGLEWPPDPKGVSDWMDNALSLRKRLASKLGWGGVLHGWQAHYNAACTFAVGMVPEELHSLRKKRKISGDSIERNNRLVQLAINELSRAVVATDSQFAAGRSVWLRRGDQDFDDLRSTHRYKAFVERYLPDAQPALTLPPNPTPLVISAHIVRLVTAYARLREAFWRQQAMENVVDATELSAESGWWRSLRDMCENYWDWRTRWELINKATNLTRRSNQLQPVIFAVRSPADWDREQVVMQNQPENLEPSEAGKHANKRPLQSSDPIDDTLSDPKRRPRRPNEAADYATELAIDRLDLLGRWLSDWRLQSLIEEAVGSTNGELASEPTSGSSSKQLVAHLVKSWKAITNWLECGIRIDECPWPQRGHGQTSAHNALPTLLK